MHSLQHCGAPGYKTPRGVGGTTQKSASQWLCGEPQLPKQGNLRETLTPLSAHGRGMKGGNDSNS